jgi:plastocyanin
MAIGRIGSTFALCGAAVLLATLAAACGGGGDDDDNGDATRPPSTSAPATQPPSNGEPSSTLQLVALNTLWDKTELRAKAGTVTIEVDNQDAGIVHNLRVFKEEGEEQEDVGMTELEAGPVKQTLVVELEVGEYGYICDSHPATMEGKLIVE